MGEMAAESHTSTEQPPAASAANDEAAQREAYDYWGYLLKPDKCGTPKLDRLLRGIADIIVSRGVAHEQRVWRADMGCRARSSNPTILPTSHHPR